MRELARSFSKLAQLPAAPDNRGRGSGSARKKFVLMRIAVGDFIGSDVLRALLALAEPNTCHNLEQLSLAVARGKKLLLEQRVEFDAEIELIEAHEQLMFELGCRNRVA